MNRSLIGRLALTSAFAVVVVLQHSPASAQANARMQATPQAAQSNSRGQVSPAITQQLTISPFALQSEIAELKQQVAALQQQLMAVQKQSAAAQAKADQAAGNVQFVGGLIGSASKRIDALDAKTDALTTSSNATNASLAKLSTDYSSHTHTFETVRFNLEQRGFVTQSHTLNDDIGMGSFLSGLNTHVKQSTSTPN